MSYVMLRIGGKEFVIYHVNRTQSREPGKKILLILISLPLALSVHVGKIRAVSSIPYLSKVELFLEQREVAFLSPNKIWENLNFSTEIQIFTNYYFYFTWHPRITGIRYVATCTSYSFMRIRINDWRWFLSPIRN